jgi:MSHA biogenesis protein MshM
LSSLYLEHFRLGEAPFGITPNGKFFFEGQARGAILDALHHAVLDEDGIVVVVGEVGSGKTMLCRMLAERLPGDQVDLVYLANPSFGPREILQSLIADWGLQPPAEGQPLVLTIQHALLQRHAQGRRAVVLIDEAQAMPPESLEEIKLLSNLETAQHKLLQIVLFGQPELDTLLALPKLRQVRDRVVHRFELQPLNGPDAAAYIEHRLRRAGWQGGALFEPRALRELTDASGGRIRAIHLLADKALLAAFAQGARQVGCEHVRMAVAEVQGGGAALRKAPASAARWLRALPWLALAAVAGLGAGGAWATAWASAPPR